MFDMRSFASATIRSQSRAEAAAVNSRPCGGAQRAAGAGIGRGSGGAKRVMATRPRRLRPSGSIVRRNGATGVPAARRHPGDVAAPRFLDTGLRKSYTTHRAGAPPGAHPHPPAGGRGDGPRAAAPERAAGIGRGKRVMATQPGHPEAIARRKLRHGPAGTWLRVAIPVKWPRAAVPGSRRTRKMARPAPTGPAQIMDAGAFRTSRIPIRKQAVAATDDGRLAPERAVGVGLRDRRHHRSEPDASHNTPFEVSMPRIMSCFSTQPKWLPHGACFHPISRPRIAASASFRPTSVR
jgi:hypothetical protein